MGGRLTSHYHDNELAVIGLVGVVTRGPFGSGY